MLRIATIVLVGALSAVGAAGAVTSIDIVSRGPRQSDGTAGLAQRAPRSPGLAQGAPAQVTKAADGHYWAEASVNGAAVRFLVDTGATAVALTAADARRLGLDIEALDYRVDVATADGKTRAAPVRLASITIAGARVNDVEALVLESGLQTSLLGMSYLGRLSSFEATRTALILKP
jgi:aspartyl protease family protein